MKEWQKVGLVGCGGCAFVMFMGVLFLGGCLFYLRHSFEAKAVHEASGTLPDLPKLDVTNPDRFLNDLMLSPLWKVEKQRDDSFVAKARSIVPDSPFDEKGRACKIFCVSVAGHVICWSASACVRRTSPRSG